MISSKALLDQTGMSRATLNNYIQLGIFPKPVVMSQSGDSSESGARLLGYFPPDALARVRAVQSLKGEGLSMAEIAEYIAENGPLPESEAGSASDFAYQPPEAQATPKPNMFAEGTVNDTDALAQADVQQLLQATSETTTLDHLPQLSIDKIDEPAYMLNYNLELTWLNEAARKKVFGFAKPPMHSGERNVFFLLSQPNALLSPDEEKALATLHLKVASERVGRDALTRLIAQGDPDLAYLVNEIPWAVKSDERSTGSFLTESILLRIGNDGQPRRQRVLSAYFREGILIVHASDDDHGDELLSFLSRRDHVIQRLLSQQLPVMTPLAVLVADMQNSVRICSELPPDEYFELINQIWHTMGQILRKYKGTHGKHAGDGIVYYFFPQPEGNYLFNVIACADEMRRAMLRINVDWQQRKNWLTQLRLNIGLHEGEEWLGTFRSQTHVEFMVLGDTINHAARLSDFADHGTIWATKGLVSRLNNEERGRVEFGVLRRSLDNGDRFVPSSYAQIDSMISPDEPRFDKLRDIAKMAVTEIRRVNLDYK